MITFWQKYKDYVFLLIIVVLLVLNIMNSNAIRTDVKQYEKRFDYIDAEINDLKLRNESIDRKIENNNTKIDIVNNKIESVDKTIRKIKENTDEKVGNIDNLKPSELELFFTNRYK
jgi:peptidoglycan hydrolase CwlO-like protein